MIGTIGPIMIVTKVAMNWQNKLASATSPHISAAASRFEFLQAITTFSDFKAGSEVVSCKLLSHNVDTIQCLINAQVISLSLCAVMSLDFRVVTLDDG